MSRTSTTAIILGLAILGALPYAGPAAPAAADKRIRHSTPAYIRKDHPSWKEKGRIIGFLRDCPGCEMDVTNDKGQICAQTKVRKDQRAYELEWLAPGTYTLRVEAPGHEKLFVSGVVVKAKHDVRIDLEFDK